MLLLISGFCVMMFSTFTLLCCLVCCNICLAATVSNNQYEAKVRYKRGVFWDGLQKGVITKNLAVDQFVDTKNTLNEVFNLINDGFSDPAPSKPTLAPNSARQQNMQVSSTTESGDVEVSSTTAAYQISRYELGRILGRNFRGLKRLANIEFSDALNATKYNLQEYKAEADRQFANSLTVEKKQKLKSLTG